MKQTKIIATIGPASESKEVLQKLYEAGANIARINCSHFEEKEFERKVKNIHELNDAGDTNFSILLDTKGPEIRTTNMETPLEVKAGDEIIVTTQEFSDVFPERIVSDYPFTIRDEKVGNIIDIDCGLLSLVILKKQKNHLLCRAEHRYTVKSRRHINLPGVELVFPGLTDFDKQHIAFGVEQGIDMVAMSFVRDKKHVEEYFSYLQEIGAPKIPVIAKIETFDGVQNIDEIIAVSNGIMVARGDLGAQVPMEQLPSIQQIIVEKCLQQGKLVVIATNMLESMIDNPTPTRAELTDVYAAVQQKTDVTMLSGESAIGKFPVESVEMMAKIIRHSEEVSKNSHHYFERNIGLDEKKKEVVKSALYLSDQTNVKAIVVFTHSGFMARTCTALRPNFPVFAFTFDAKTAKKLNFFYGVYPVLINQTTNEEQLAMACEYLRRNDIFQEGDEIVVLINGKANDSDAPEMRIVQL